MSLDQPTSHVVLYEGESSVPLVEEDRFLIMQDLLSKGYRVTLGVDLNPALIGEGQPVLVLGRFNGQLPEKELDGNGNGNGPVEFRDIEGIEGSSVSNLVVDWQKQVEAEAPGGWKPWFPVIDYDRCTNCMQCLSFCLFGVYGVDDKQQIQVQNNDQCKTNCPACSRVCPEAAIMFPKYKSGPINGDLVSAADLDREKMKVDISSLLGGDVYQMLRQRSERAQSRFSKERDSDKALKERQKCLVKLQQDVDIPPEVLMSLPSPDEILKKAEAAKARADAVLKDQAAKG